MGFCESESAKLTRVLSCLFGNSFDFCDVYVGIGAKFTLFNPEIEFVIVVVTVVTCYLLPGYMVGCCETVRIGIRFRLVRMIFVFHRFTDLLDVLFALHCFVYLIQSPYRVPLRHSAPSSNFRQSGSH